MKTIGPLELDGTGTRIRQAEIEATETAPFRPRRDVARMEIDSPEAAREIVRAVNAFPLLLECVEHAAAQNEVQAATLRAEAKVHHERANNAHADECERWAKAFRACIAQAKGTR